VMDGKVKSGSEGYAGTRGLQISRPESERKLVLTTSTTEDSEPSSILQASAAPFAQPRDQDEGQRWYVPKAVWCSREGNERRLRNTALSLALVSSFCFLPCIPSNCTSHVGVPKQTHCSSRRPANCALRERFYELRLSA